jgi:hypothetical protein
MTDSWGRIVCSMGGTTTAICTEMMSGTGANFPGTSTIDIAQSDITFLPVTVTAGLTTTASTSTTSDVTSSALTSNKTHASGSTAPSTSVASSATVASHSSTGGLSRITGSPRVVLGGAAAALVVAAW